MIELLSKPTRFRAYQLGCLGSSFSYFDGTNFFLIEAMLTEISEKSLVQEIYECGKINKIEVLHITSWDNDHCSPLALRRILTFLKPDQIDIPGYLPHTDSGKESLGVINSYINNQRLNNHYVEVLDCSPNNNRLLPQADSFQYHNVILSPYFNYDGSNNNSTVMLFRTGAFTVLSLGDVESSEISEDLINNKIANSEVDVMILAHHGADNGFTTDRFVKVINPKVEISSSNFGNQFEHPPKEIKDILEANDVNICTTKTGDVIIKSIGDHKLQYEVRNLVGNSSDKKTFTTKRAQHSYSPLLRDVLRYK